jgi:hypothetical protein
MKGRGADPAYGIVAAMFQDDEFSAPVWIELKN